MVITQKTSALIVTSLLFFVFGITAAIVGPVFPEFAAQNGVSLAMIGAILTGIFVGALIGQLVFGVAAERFGQRTVLFSGMLLLAAGLVLLTLSRTLVLSVIYGVIIGVGHGTIDLASNVSIAKLFEEKSVSALNLLNTFFGVGAFVGPVLISVSIRVWSTGFPVFWFCAIFLGGLFFVLLRIQNAIPKRERGGDHSPTTSGKFYRSVLLWICGLIVLVYVGAEYGMGGWTALFMQKSAGMTVENAALITAVFWLAITGGRIISIGLGLKVDLHGLLVGGFAGSILGGLMMLYAGGNPVISIAGVVIIGLCFGPVYPTMMAYATRTFADHPERAASLAGSMGSIGGMILPWGQGIILNEFGATASAAFITIAAGVMLLLAVLLARGTANHSKQSG